MFVREEWELFRSIGDLSHKAGVPREKIAALVAKELVDNALDASVSCEFGELGDDGFYVQDKGDGIDPAQVADLFSISRPLKSTKLIRLPSRGALGNGMRVVAGAVLATDGKLIVSTRGTTLNLIPQHDGTTISEKLGDYPFKGTRIEVHLGKDAGPIDLRWAFRARMFSSLGKNYKGKTSPWWYTSRDFHGLCLAAKEMTARDLVIQFEGCSGKVGTIVDGFKGRRAADLTLQEARTLLERMRAESSPVNANRLGYVGDIGHLSSSFSNYVKATGVFQLSSDEEVAEIPFVVEAWSELSEEAAIYVHVNRTPVTGEIEAFHNKTDIILSGCGIRHRMKDIGRRPATIWLNITTPYMPITTEGKSPDLSYILQNGIYPAIKKSINRAKRNKAEGPGRRSQKSVVLSHLNEGIMQASGDGEYRYSLRQLYYALRPFVLEELGQELSYENFSNKIITEYEKLSGKELPGLYRDDRGTLYHPHLSQEISLGTRSVEEYQRPEWTFKRILYSEKEGFFEILKNVKWPERHDCALLTSKGYASRAARDLLDMLGDTDEDITFFCIHDADAYGTLIYQSLQEATSARPKRRVEVVNLGLEPREALEMDLGVERLEGEKAKPVASYVEPEYAEWLQHNRVELNAMSTPQFLEWLDRKMAVYGDSKLIPPDPVLADRLHKYARRLLKSRITEEILKSQDLEGRVLKAYDQVKPELKRKAESLSELVAAELEEMPEQSWRDPVRQAAEEILGD